MSSAESLSYDYVNSLEVIYITKANRRFHLPRKQSSGKQLGEGISARPKSRVDLHTVETIRKKGSLSLL